MLPFRSLRASVPSSLRHLLNKVSLQTGGAGGNAGDASGGQGTDFTLNANHQTAGGAAGSNANSASNGCVGSCIITSSQTAAGANGGAAQDASNVSVQGNVANTDSSGGASVGGAGGSVRFPLSALIFSMLVSVF